MKKYIAKQVLVFAVLFALLFWVLTGTTEKSAPLVDVLVFAFGVALGMVLIGALIELLSIAVLARKLKTKVINIYLAKYALGMSEKWIEENQESFEYELNQALQKNNEE